MSGKSESIMDYSVKFWNGVVYGPPGVGKTIFCGTSQKRSTYIFDVDNGMTSLRSHIIKNGLKQDMVKVKRVESFVDFTDGISEMERIKPEIVVLDSATELFRILKRDVTATAGRETPELRDWGRVLDVMEAFTAQMRYKNCHFIMTAHEWTKVDPTMGLTVARPSFQGRFADEYGKHFSWIARLESLYAETQSKDDEKKKETIIKRRLNFGPHPQMHHKDRSGMMRKLEPANIDHILDRMIAAVDVAGHLDEPKPDDSDS